MRILTLAMALTLSACVTNMGMLSTVASSDNLVEGPLLATAVEGEDCMHTVLFIPAGKLNPGFAPAIRSAIRSVDGGVYMTDIEVTAELIYFYLYSRRCIRVSGDVRGQPVSLAGPR